MCTAHFTSAASDRRRSAALRLPARLDAVFCALLAPPLLLLLTGIAACPSQDGDGDGYSTSDGDCDDTDASVHPGAAEVCDGFDQDCDGQIDDGLTVQPWYADLDRDLYGDPDRLETACAAPDGYISRAGDCDDDDPDVHPGVQETCDGIDQDCDGTIDDGAIESWYIDQDGDGFGSALETACEAREGFVESRGDCDDADPAVHPGAPDPAADGRDQDCGGSAGGDPHLGYPASTLSSVQSALDAATPGTVVWVGPGRWLEHDLSFRGKALTLISSHFSDRTTLDADGLGRVFRFDMGEGPDAVLDGFTLTGGVADRGGAVQIVSSSPSLRLLSVTGNKAPAEGALGAGIYLEDSSASLTACTIDDNDAGACEETITCSGGCPYGYYIYNTACTFARGGGLAMERSAPLVIDTWIGWNRVYGDGGGVYAHLSEPVLSGVDLVENIAEQSCDGYEYYNSAPFASYTCKGGRGGATTAEASSLTVRGGSLRANTAAFLCYSTSISSSTVQTYCYPGLGGGAWIDGEGSRFDAVEVTDNEASDGGGIFSLDGALSVGGGVLSQNRATPYNLSEGGHDYHEDDFQGGRGGALYLEEGSPGIDSVTFRENTAFRGGALYARRSSPTIDDSTFYMNVGGGKAQISSLHGIGGDQSTTSTAGGEGGGIYLEQAPASIFHAVFSGNVAVTGGAGYLSGSSATLEHGLLIDNSATGSTTSFYTYTSSSGSSTYTYVPNGGQSGALRLEGSSPFLRHVVVVGNQAVEVCAWEDGSSTSSWICDTGEGGGITVASGSLPSIQESVLAYNGSYDLYRFPESSAGATVRWSDLYSPDGPSHNLAGLDESNLEVEPGFLSYSSGMPTSYHLALSSALVDAGASEAEDVDGSRADIGMYGGPLGGDWDRDGDGYFDWFWPGTIDDAPAGFDPAEYDCEDLDPSVRNCAI